MKFGRTDLGPGGREFTSVSLDPPLVAFLPDRSSSSWPKVREYGHFCVNIIAEDQLDLCKSFAKSGGDKFEGIAHRLSPRGNARA